MIIENNVNYGNDQNSLKSGIKIDLGYSHDLSHYRIFKYNYYNLDVFLKTIATFPINHNVFSHPASIYNDYQFTRTKSFEEAWNLCRFGWDEGYDQFIEGLNHLQLKRSEIETKKKEYQPVGYTPNVSKFLCSNPNNMRIIKPNVVKNAITVSMEIDYSAFTNPQAVIHRGICVLNLITYLEKLGFDCILQFESISVEKDEMIHIVVPIKRKEEKLNIKMCYFPLVHPSFLRRLIFRSKEIIPNCSLGWSDVYGYPYKKNDREIMKLENTIYISTPSEMNILGDDLDIDFENFVNYIDMKYHLRDMKKGEDEKWQKVYGKKV